MVGQHADEVAEDADWMEVMAAAAMAEKATTNRAVAGGVKAENPFVPANGGGGGSKYNRRGCSNKGIISANRGSVHYDGTRHGHLRLLLPFDSKPR